MTKRQRIEEALAARYEFRYNVLTGTIEFRSKTEGVYKYHTDYDMNSIIREIDRVGENVSEAMYYSIVKSDFTERYHPLKHYFLEYLKDLGEAQGTDNIQKLAATVTVPNPEEWYLSLKRWLVASVANSLTDKGCQNHTCIVFTGGMGLFKTTWLSLLCPPLLAPDAILTGKIDLNLANKDTFMYLATKFIMNLDDQLRNLMKKDSETMKTLITHPEISIRRPFAKFSETLPRIANFVGSINGEDFLAENENRRFLPFRIKAIDINTAQQLNMNLVWNEALALWRSGYKYWWDKEELEAAFPDMNSFAYASDELELLTTHFEVPDSREKANVTMNATEIAAYFKSSSGLVMSTKKIGEALKSLKAIQVKIRQGGTVITKYALIDLSKADKPQNLMRTVEAGISKPVFK